MKKIKLKIIVGYREEQRYTIDSEEAHKAYYLFRNPEARAVFSNGVAIVGKNIMGIEPDYQATMGWNPTHILENDDWNEIKDEGVDKAARDLLYEAKLISEKISINEVNEKLSDLKPKLLN